jgi:putative ABC transport system substrate-binding protein
VAACGERSAGRARAADWRSDVIFGDRSTRSTSRQGFPTIAAGPGWVEGRNVRFDYRWTGSNTDKIRTFADELVRLNPDVLLANGPSLLAGLQQATRTLPIVFVIVDDPVGAGFVSTIANPGGNTTGFSSFESSLGGKWLGLLKEVGPHITHVGILFNPITAPYVQIYFRSVEAAASSFGITVAAAQVRDTSDLDGVISTYTSNGALIVPPDTFTVVHRALIIALAAEHRVPVVYPFRYFAIEGGLMVYGIDTLDLYRRGASYVDRILRGIKPADLPVQQPTKFEFLINLKTAKALGLTVPDRLLVAADEVIE